MFLQQARQLLPQRAFFLVGHCHRWFACASPGRLGKSVTIIAFSTRAFKLVEKSTPIKGFAMVCRGPEPGVPSPLWRVCATLKS
jgi:hypothetical protein